jgi:serine/threonine-protein kinase
MTDAAPSRELGADVTPDVGDVVADKYRIDARLGEGGMGVVFEATNVLTHKRVALKWIHPRTTDPEQATKRFLREARAAGRIAHPNVVDVYDVGRAGDSFFLVMELLRGEPASRLIGSEAGPQPPSMLVDVLMPAMRGIHAAHEAGVVHRDLKPDNLFLCRDAEGELETTKVLDFGISKAIAEEEELNGITKTGAVVGTPHYMAPEHLRGHRALDRRADVYALGVILYEGLTGVMPFHADTFPALVIKIATSTAPPPSQHRPSLDPALEAIVMKALAPEPADRFATVAELALALEPFGTTTFAGRRSSISGSTAIPRSSESTGERAHIRDEGPSTAERTLERTPKPSSGVRLAEPLVQGDAPLADAPIEHEAAPEASVSARISASVSASDALRGEASPPDAVMTTATSARSTKLGRGVLVALVALLALGAVSAFAIVGAGGASEPSQPSPTQPAGSTAPPSEGPPPDPARTATEEVGEAATRDGDRGGERAPGAASEGADRHETGAPREIDAADPGTLGSTPSPVDEPRRQARPTRRTRATDDAPPGDEPRGRGMRTGGVSVDEF